LVVLHKEIEKNHDNVRDFFFIRYFFISHISYILIITKSPPLNTSSVTL